MKIYSFVALLSVFIISSIAMADEKADEHSIKLLVFGDSLTAGYGLPQEQAFPAVLEKKLQDNGHKVEVIAASVSGETTAGGLSRIEKVIQQKPDVVFIALGANDALRGKAPEQAKENLTAMITMLRRQGIHVWVAGMKAPKNMGADYVKKFDGMFDEMKRELGIQLYPFLLEGVAMKPELNLKDGIHPNAEGVELMVNNILQFVQVRLDEIK